MNSRAPIGPEVLAGAALSLLVVMVLALSFDFVHLYLQSLQVVILLSFPPVPFFGLLSGPGGARKNAWLINLGIRELPYRRSTA